MAIKSGIYKIENQVNGQFYIGSAIDLDKRWHNHKSDFNKGKHGNGHLQRSWNKYGADNFTFEVLEYCEPSELIRMEQGYLDSTGACENGYNICSVAGSRLGTKMPPDAVRRSAEARRGRKVSDEARRNMSLSRIGRIVSEETRKKISESNKGKSHPPTFAGRTHSAETREKLSIARMKRTTSEETRRKMSATRMGKKMPPFTEEHRKNISIAQKNRKPFTEEHVRHMREGHKITPEYREKLSLAVTEWWRRRKIDNNISL